MNKIDISIGEVVEVVTTSPLSVRQFIENLYVNNETIVHCVNNDVDYPTSKKDSLIAYMELSV